MVITQEQADGFVASWLDAWNAHDLDAVMAMCHPDVRFESSFLVTMGIDDAGVLQGRDALRGWFAAALEDPAFRIDPALHVLPGLDTVVLVERIGGTVAANVFTLDAAGLVTRSQVHG